MKNLLLIIFISFLLSVNVNATNIAEELTQLNNLFKEGAITKDEFTKAKNILLKGDLKKDKKNLKDKTKDNPGICLKNTFKGGSYISNTGIPYFKRGLKCNEETDEEVLDRYSYWLLRMPMTERSNPSYAKMMKVYHPELHSSLSKDQDLSVKKTKAVKKEQKQKKKVTKVTKEEKRKEFDFVSANRSEMEIKNGVFLEDVEAFGTFEKINTAPLGMFETKHNQFVKMSKYSQSKIGLIFVNQKRMLDKYPENLMLGMGYFEFFYMQQLKDHNRDIARFIDKQPNIRPATRKAIKKIYSLNKARKAMRNALGFTLEDDVQEVLNTYYTLSQLFSLGEKEVIKLSSEEKKLFKTHLKLAKNLSIIKNLVKDKNEQRINDKKFKKEYLKVYKKVDRIIKGLNKYNNYNQFDKFLDTIQEIELSNGSTLLSAYNLADFLLTEIKNKDVKKRFKIDLTNADFSSFKENELKLLGKASNTTKLVKAKKSNKIQLDILNLENNNIPINKILDEFRDNSLDLASINFQMESVDKMKRWARKDWANAWRTPIPEKIDDNSKGIMIDLSQEDVESIKAQLSIDHYKDLLNLDMAKELNDSVNDIQNSIDTSTFSFSYGLDDYAQFLGEYMNLDITNYADLTALANATYSANWSVEEYASAYQTQVDVVNLLQSGAVNSFDASSIATGLGASLNDVVETIAAAGAAGISVDLEAAAAGAGYGSFADAVSAYNAANGTNYTEAEAREALGQ